MKNFILTLSALLLASSIFSQTKDSSVNKHLAKNFAENACKCIDSIDVFEKKRAQIVAEVNHCIDEQCSAYQLSSKLMNIEELKNNAQEKDGKKEIKISININKESGEYKKYYFEIERYLMTNCNSLKEKITVNDGVNSKSFSSNEVALDLYSKALEVTKKGDYKKAIDYYREALKIDSLFVFAWDNMGMCYRRLEDYDKALEAYQKSLKIDSTGIMPLQNIPVVYLLKKEYVKAIMAYEKLAELDNNNPEVFYGIGNIYTTYLMDFEKGLSYMCKAYNLYVEQKSPYRSDAEKLIKVIYQEMKTQGKEARFEEILKENHIRTK